MDWIKTTHIYSFLTRYALWHAILTPNVTPALEKEEWLCGGIVTHHNPRSLIRMIFVRL